MHDETVKLTWKTGSEEEWFPAQVLTVSYSKAETSSSSKSNSQKNRMNVGEEAANAAQQRNMDYLDQAYKSSGIEYLSDAVSSQYDRISAIRDAHIKRFTRPLYSARPNHW